MNETVEPHNQKPTLSTPEAAAYLGLAVSTLNKWRVYGTAGPRFLKLGRAVRYLRSDLDAFLEQQAASSTAEFRTF